MQEKLAALSQYVSAALAEAVIAAEMHGGELCCRVKREALTSVLKFLRDDPNCAFTVLCDLCGVDFPDRPLRFEVVYNLLSMRLNQRIRIKVDTDEEQPVPSVVGLFSSAGVVGARSVGPVRDLLRRQLRPSPHFDRLRF